MNFRMKAIGISRPNPPRILISHRIIANRAARAPMNAHRLAIGRTLREGIYSTYVAQSPGSFTRHSVIPSEAKNLLSPPTAKQILRRVAPQDDSVRTNTILQVSQAAASATFPT